jgi:hypothetical protein
MVGASLRRGRFRDSYTKMIFTAIPLAGYAGAVVGWIRVFRKELVMRVSVTLLAVVGLFGMVLAGCSSTHEKGVTSNMMEQWTTVSANTQTTTNAAKAVLEDKGLKDVKASSTMVDGTASGKQADGTNVTVSIKKKTDNVSEVTVKVGAMGNPSLGAEIAKDVKNKAEGK